MLLLAFAALLGCLAGTAAGGSVRNIAKFPMRGWWLLIVALLAQALLSLFSPALRATIVVAASAALVLWCIAVRAPSHTRLGITLLVTGIVANMVTIALNGGMPVSRTALTAAGLPKNFNVARGQLDKHVAMNAATSLRFLGDDIPIPGIHNVMSAGDVVMLVGIFFVLRGATLLASPAQASTSKAAASATN